MDMSVGGTRSSAATRETPAPPRHPCAACQAPRLSRALKAQRFALLSSPALVPAPAVAPVQLNGKQEGPAFAIGERTPT